MRFLADESCDFAVVRTLRGAGQDILAVGEIAPGAEDSVVIDLARNEARILLTEDRDFGQLVYAAARSTSGVIYIRYPTQARHALPQEVLTLITQHRDRLIGQFTVMQPGRTRTSRLP